jgi:UDP-N-acetylmuramoyl-L-alanyl-D-glutamate--2,6-diaminopimelate ligase
MLNTLKSYIGGRNPIRILWHRSKGLLAALWYGFPAKKVHVIGITGTDGKTTTVGMTAHILSQNDIRCGALSTAFVRIGDTEEWNETQKTSPSPFVIQRFLRDCKKAKCTHAVLECSSHGLVQGRLTLLLPSVAGITNISKEHLDYHGTMDQYVKDKSILFKMLRKRGRKVLNRDDQTFESYSSIRTIHTVSYSVTSTDATLSVSQVQLWPLGCSAIVHSEDDDNSAELKLSIPGEFNIENALCAIGCTSGSVRLTDACKALESFTGVPGRMESIDEGQKFSVFVDFTVTPAAYEKTLLTLRKMIEPGKRILVLTGSCGDRMKEKRPVVGALCSTLADVVVVTNEDPYTEDPQAIIDEVWAGVDQSACKATKIFDRKEAIQWILKEAQEGDTVILCAKGSDTTMWVADGQIPWNEREVTREFLKSL